MPIGIGDVILLYTRNAIPPDYKRVIIVGESPDSFLGVFVNTNLHGTFEQKERLKPFQPKFDDVGRPYLDYPSHIDCSQPYEFSKAEMISSVQANIDNHKGTCLNTDLTQIITLIKTCPVVAPKLVKKYNL